MNVIDLELKKPDKFGVTVTRIFARKAPVYAVYEADWRIMVTFADEVEKEQAQRKAMSALAPLRGEIDGLLDGWREGTNRTPFGTPRGSSGLLAKAIMYNRRVADALIVALEDDIPNATAILDTIKRDIMDERVARARFEYMIAAGLGAFALMFMSWLITATYPLLMASPPAATARAAMTAPAVAAQPRAAPTGTPGKLVAAPGRRTAPAPDTSRSARARGVAGILLFAAGLVSFGLIYVQMRAGFNAAYRAQKSVERAQAEYRRQLVSDPTADEPDYLRVPGPWEVVASAVVPGLLLFFAIALPVWAVLWIPSYSNIAVTHYPGSYSDVVTLWRAAAAGSIGAFFSIAIGIRKRTVLPDLLRTSNLMDAALRISIGFIGGGVLMALLIVKVVSLKFGDFTLGDTSLMGVLVAGFIAGFSERLVPDLLDQASVKVGTPTPAPRAIPPIPPKKDGDGGGDGDAGKPKPDDPDGSDPLPEEAHADGCASDHEVEDDQVMDDAQLPAASGGVAVVPGPASGAAAGGPTP